jgi:hypothetical protein
MITMRHFFKRIFPFAGLAVLLVLTFALVPAIADSANGNDVLEKAAEAVEAGVSMDFVDAAINEARAAGLGDGDVEEMLEDLKEAYEDGTGADLNAIVADHIAGNGSDADVDDDDDADVDDDDDADVDDDDDGDLDDDDDGDVFDDSGSDDDDGDDGDDDGDDGDDDGDDGGDDGDDDDD